MQSTFNVDEFHESELLAAKAVLEKETAVVQNELGGADFPGAHASAWQEMQTEVVFIPSKKAYGRLSLASKKDVISMREQQLEAIRGQLEKDAKKASKLEKKAMKLTMGYQSRVSKTTVEVCLLCLGEFIRIMSNYRTITSHLFLHFCFLTNQMDRLNGEIVQANEELVAFTRLRDLERDSVSIFYLLSRWFLTLNFVNFHFIE